MASFYTKVPEVFLFAFQSSRDHRQVLSGGGGWKSLRRPARPGATDARPGDVAASYWKKFANEQCTRGKGDVGTSWPSILSDRTALNCR